MLVPLTGYAKPYYMSKLVAYLLVEASSGEDYVPQEEDIPSDEEHIANRREAMGGYP